MCLWECASVSTAFSRLVGPAYGRLPGDCDENCARCILLRVFQSLVAAAGSADKVSQQTFTLASQPFVRIAQLFVAKRIPFLEHQLSGAVLRREPLGRSLPCIFQDLSRVVAPSYCRFLTIYILRLRLVALYNNDSTSQFKLEYLELDSACCL